MAQKNKPPFEAQQLKHHQTNWTDREMAQNGAEKF